MPVITDVSGHRLPRAECGRGLAAVPATAAVFLGGGGWAYSGLGAMPIPSWPISPFRLPSGRPSVSASGRPAKRNGCGQNLKRGSSPCLGGSKPQTVLLVRVREGRVYVLPWAPLPLSTLPALSCLASRAMGCCEVAGATHFTFHTGLLLLRAER